MVPMHWAVKRLRYNVSLNPPVRSGLSPDTEVSFLPMEAIGVDGSINLDRNRLVADVSNGYSYFENGDLAFAKVTPCFENGKGAIMQGLARGVGFGTTELTVLRPKKETNLNFASYVLQSARFRSLGTGAMTGAGGLKRVPDEFTRNFESPWPETHEQRMVANYLDTETARIDGLVAKKNRFIDILREKRQALITHAVTKGLDPDVKMKESGVEWVGEMPEHWTICKLSFRYSIELGKMLDEKRLTGNSLVPYLRNQDVQWGSINTNDLPKMDIYAEEIERYTIQCGDLLVCEGGDVGRAAIWKESKKRIGFQKALHRLRPRSDDRDTSEFFYFSLLTGKQLGLFEESDAKATIAHLPAEKFRQYKFAFPPLTEQRMIVDYINNKSGRLDALISKTEHSIKLLKERRSALITAAVTGQIDVREAA